MRYMRETFLAVHSAGAGAFNKEADMKKCMTKQACACFLALLLALGVCNLAEAGPMSITVTDAEAGGMTDGGSRQNIIFWMTVKNISSAEYIARLNSVSVEIEGTWGSRGREVYRRDVSVNHTFNPVLEPRKSKKLCIRFKRKVNPNRNMFRYDQVRVRVLKYNFNRTS